MIRFKYSKFRLLNGTITADTVAYTTITTETVIEDALNKLPSSYNIGYLGLTAEQGTKTYWQLIDSNILELRVGIFQYGTSDARGDYLCAFLINKSISTSKTFIPYGSTEFRAFTGAAHTNYLLIPTRANLTGPNPHITLASNNGYSYLFVFYEGVPETNKFHVSSGGALITGQALKYGRYYTIGTNATETSQYTLSGFYNQALAEPSVSAANTITYSDYDIYDSTLTNIVYADDSPVLSEPAPAEPAPVVPTRTRARLDQLKDQVSGKTLEERMRELETFKPPVDDELGLPAPEAAIPFERRFVKSMGKEFIFDAASSQWKAGATSIYSGDTTSVKQAEVINSGSLYGQLNIAANTPVALRFGAANLTGRHSVIVINTSNNPVFVGFDNTVTKETGIPVNAGQERLFSVNPAESLTLYAIAEAITSIRLVEVK